MNHTNSPDSIAAKTAKVQANIAALSEPLATLDRQIETLRDRAESLSEGVTSRDWTLGAGSRPPASTENQHEALRARRRLYEEQLAALGEVRELEAVRGPIKRDLDELRYELAKLVRAAVTPETLQSDIDRLEAALEQTLSQRPALEFQMARALANSQAADDAELANSAASEALTEGLADSFLANDGERAKNELRIGQLQTDKAIAAELAAAARAARARIDKAIEQARGLLHAFDMGIAGQREGITGQREAIAAKRTERARLLALHAFDAAVDSVHVALGGLCRAAPEEGKELARALRYEGLVQFNQDRRLVAPAWLDGAFNGHRQLARPEMLVNSDHEAAMSM